MAKVKATLADKIKQQETKLKVLQAKQAYEKAVAEAKKK